MLKKIISTTLVISMLVCLYACGAKTSNLNEANSNKSPSVDISESSITDETVSNNNTKTNDENKVFQQLNNCKTVSDYADNTLAENMDSIKFGYYYLTNSSNKEPIEWLVLEKGTNDALLITKYAIDAKSYNDENVPTTWETSSLRQWLNNEFISTAFDNDEQSLLIESTVSADKNPDSDVNVGNATNDKVFLLSINECNKYFTSNEKRECKATNYAISNECAYTDEDDYDGMYVGNCMWSLRTPGDDQYLVSGVYSEGEIATWGTDLVGEYGKSGVRPVIKIRIN